MSLDHATNIVKHQTPTRDAFLAGRLVIAQPQNGFRAGLDSVLLGAAVGTERGALLDLGAGVGTAGLVALALRPELTATLVDSDPEALALAAENIAVNGFAARATIQQLDLASPSTTAANRPEPDHFATVIANPPFFTTGKGTLPNAPGRTAARHMAASALDLWARAAAGAAAPGGEVLFILPAASLAPLLAAFEPRFGALTVLPFSPFPGAPATRILMRGIKGSRAPLTLLASRALHADRGGGFTPEIEAILRGEQRLLW